MRPRHTSGHDLASEYEGILFFPFSVSLFSQAHSYTSMPTDYKNHSCLLLWEHKNQFQHSKLGNTGHETLQIRAMCSIELFVQMMRGQKICKRFLKICFFKCFHFFFHLALSSPLRSERELLWLKFERREDLACQWMI